MRSVPMRLICSSTLSWALFTRDTMIRTSATPMTMPTMDSPVRSL